MNYEKPEMEFIKFASKDVICTSDPNSPTYGGWGGDYDDAEFQ